jgi:NAD(P)-dependent dehydrogenase (short-subunit alcohol dehydrogenase family)
VSAPGAAHPLAGKCALVTGASRGIGRGVALALARAGCDVAIAARTVPDLEQVGAKIEALGRKAVVIPADVRDDRSVQLMVNAALDAFSRLDILVNNAGLGFFGPIEDMPI